MKLEVEPTNLTTSVNGKRLRVWRGTTSQGDRVVLLGDVMFVIGDSRGLDELREQLERSPPLKDLPLSDVLKRFMES